MEDDDFISKTRRKKRMTGLQDLGAELVKLSAEQLARVDMPENLREAVNAARRITKHEARRRQLQYIGRLMRDLDADPIAAQLAAIQAPSKRQTALFHVAERWRDEIVADSGAIARFASEFPGADAERLRALALAAHEERGKPGTPRRTRELFHALNAIVQEHARGNP